MNGKNGKHVIFGTGPVGVSVAEALIHRGINPTMVNRSGNPSGGYTGKNVTWKACDLRNPSDVNAAAGGATHIYHCANPLYHQWAELLPPMQAILVDTALKNQAVLILSENLYMYERGAEVISESTPENPPTRKGRIRLELSRGLIRSGLEENLDWVSVRASDYYGPWAGYQSMFGTDRFLDLLARGKSPSLLGSLRVPHSYTYVGDFGEALVRAALNPSSHGRSWICPNAPAITTGSLAQMFIDNWPGELPSGLRVRTLPKSLLKIAGLFDPVVRELIEMLYQKEEPYVVDGSLFGKTFDMMPTDPETGVRKTLDWYEASITEKQTIPPPKGIR